MPADYEIRQLAAAATKLLEKLTQLVEKKLKEDANR